MAWKIIQTEIEDETTLTDSELIGLAVLAREYMGEPENERNVYWRAWQKLLPLAREANREDGG